MPAFGGHDIELIRQSRSRDGYKDFSDEERGAHQRVHAALGQLGQIAVDELGGARDYVLKLTSGFHPNSGVRGGKPKDLWFGVYRKENEKHFLGNPQVFMIVSERGVEYGFSPLTHPDDFTNPGIKYQTRKIARLVLEQLPVPGSLEAKDLASQLSISGGWHFRRKQRLDAGQSEFQSLDDWLSFVRSDEGVRNAGGGITRYALAHKIDEIDFAKEVREMARLFRPLMEHIVADAPPAAAPRAPIETPPLSPSPNVILPAFGELVQAFLREFAKVRNGPFQKTDPLWDAMSAVKGRLEKFPAVQGRPDLLVNISVGQGNWAAVPWIALLNTKVTQSMQEGIYVVFLITTGLDRIFLTLNQGATNLVRDLGQSEAQKRMLDVAGKARRLVSDLTAAGFLLDNEISLGGGGWFPKNYEIGTIAHVDFDAINMPHDDRMNELLEAVLGAYDRVIEAPEPQTSGVIDDDKPKAPEPYGMEDALSELFLDQPALERLLAIWSPPRRTGRRQELCGKTSRLSSSRGKRLWPCRNHPVSSILQLRRLRPGLSA
jgi:5-methylcytosine-specific restriction enzyme MrcB-like protein